LIVISTIIIVLIVGFWRGSEIGIVLGPRLELHAQDVEHDDARENGAHQGSYDHVDDWAPFDKELGLDRLHRLAIAVEISVGQRLVLVVPRQAPPEGQEECYGREELLQCHWPWAAV